MFWHCVYKHLVTPFPSSLQQQSLDPAPESAFKSLNWFEIYLTGGDPIPPTCDPQHATLP
ncbi:hypothetical protein CGCF415_v015149 [Colletotrichum fructicola]|nr:hypothetical protein CGCFRS4_v015364 [Colletotrichum fructicola]KAF4886404.1 hypothetical protein CGCF415_v015149 [Colletotrichum fructicola]KAF4922424.1 hypothetical protein CGCF245_v015341 [Colletotrichum fructicola]